MRFNKKFLLLGLLLNLTGCGKDEQSAKQISELQERLLKLESELESIKKIKAVVKYNQDSNKYLAPKVKRLQTDLQKVIKSLASGESKFMNPNQTKGQSPEITAKNMLTTQVGNLSNEHKKLIALIRSYLPSTQIKNIPQKLNEREFFHPDDKSKWDRQKLIRFIETYSIPRESIK